MARRGLAQQAAAGLRLHRRSAPTPTCEAVPVGRLPSQTHQLERRPSEEAVGVAEGFGQFEMVIVLADQEPNLLAGVFNRGGEFAVLARKFGGLPRAES